MSSSPASDSALTTLVQIIGVSIPLALIVVILALFVGAYISGRPLTVRSVFSAFTSAFKDEPVEGVRYQPSRLPDVIPTYTDPRQRGAGGMEIRDMATPNSVLYAALATPPDDAAPANGPATAAPFVRESRFESYGPQDIFDTVARNARDKKKAAHKSHFQSLKAKAEAIAAGAKKGKKPKKPADDEDEDASHFAAPNFKDVMRKRQQEQSHFVSQPPAPYAELEPEHHHADDDELEVAYSGADLGVSLSERTGPLSDANNKEAFADFSNGNAHPELNQLMPLSDRDGSIKNGTGSDLFRPSPHLYSNFAAADSGSGAMWVNVPDKVVAVRGGLFNTDEHKKQLAAQLLAKRK